MTREEILRMANEAWDADTNPWLTYEQRFLVRFAALVAAAEREACVKVCEPQAPHDAPLPAWKIAAAIRARSKE